MENDKVSDYSDIVIERKSVVECLRKHPGAVLYSESPIRAKDVETKATTLLAQQMCVHAFYEVHQGASIVLHMDVAPNFVRVRYNAVLELTDILHDGELSPLRCCPWDDKMMNRLQPFLGGLTLPIAYASHFHIHVQHEQNDELMSFEKGECVQHDTSVREQTTLNPHTCLEYWFDDELLWETELEEHILLDFLNHSSSLTDLKTSMSHSTLFHLHSSSITTHEYEAHLKTNTTLANKINKLTNAQIEVGAVLRWCEGWPQNAWLYTHQGSSEWVPNELLYSLLDSESQKLVQHHQDESKHCWNSLEWTPLSDLDYPSDS